MHVVKNPPANAEDIRDAGLLPGLGRSPGGVDAPLQCSGLENPRDRGACCAAIPGAARVNTTEAIKHSTIFLYMNGIRMARNRLLKLT